MGFCFFMNLFESPVIVMSEYVFNCGNGVSVILPTSMYDWVCGIVIRINKFPGILLPISLSYICTNFLPISCCHTVTMMRAVDSVGRYTVIVLGKHY